MESLLVFDMGLGTVFQHAQKSTNIVLGSEVVTRTTSLPVNFVRKLAYNWLLRFCGIRPG